MRAREVSGLATTKDLERIVAALPSKENLAELDRYIKSRRRTDEPQFSASSGATAPKASHPPAKALLNTPSPISQKLPGDLRAAGSSSESPNQKLQTSRPRVIEIRSHGIVNAASFNPLLAPGAVAQIFFEATGLNIVSAQATGVPLPNALNGVSVIVNGRPAPMFFVGAGQVEFQVPYATELGSASVVLKVNDQASGSALVEVAAAAPGIFSTGNNSALIANQSLVMNSPVRAGELITIYVTGLGLPDSAPTDGHPAPANPLSRARIKASVKIGGKDADVVFAGLAPTLVGLGQVSAIVPPGTPQGMQQVVITQDGHPSNSPVVVVAD